MHSKWQRLLFIFTGLLMAAPAQAQWYRDKWEFTPFVGYETSGSYPATSTTLSSNITKVRADGAVSFGTFLDYSLTHNAQVEFMWDRNPTSYTELQFVGPPIHAFDSKIDQYQFGLSYLLLSSERKVRPYIAGSLGFTHEFNTGQTPNRTDFAYSIGGGLKYQWTQHIGFRGDARYLPTYANSSIETFCDPFFGCFNAKVSHYQSRGNFVAGVIFGF